MERLVLKVDGMMCGGCENRVQNALKTLEGVEEVVASYKEGTVTVSFNEKTSKEAIKEKIEDIGYEVK